MLASLRSSAAALSSYFCLLAPRQFGRWRAPFQEGQDSVTGTFVRQCQVERCHAVVILQVQGIGVGVDEQPNHLLGGLIGGGHVEGQGAVLVPDRGALRVAGQEQLHGFHGCLPHGGLVDGQIAGRIGLGGPARIGPQ
jgi:hypothetical protein